MEIEVAYIGVIGTVLGAIVGFFLQEWKSHCERKRLEENEIIKINNWLKAELRQNRDICAHNKRRIDVLITMQTYPSWIRFENQVGRLFIQSFGGKISEEVAYCVIDYIVQVEHVNKQLELCMIPYANSLETERSKHYINLLGVVSSDYLSKKDGTGILKTFEKVESAIQFPLSLDKRISK